MNRGLFPNCRAPDTREWFSRRNTPVPPPVGHNVPVPDVAIEVTPEIGVAKIISHATSTMTANPSTYDTHVWGPELELDGRSDSEEKALYNAYPSLPLSVTVRTANQQLSRNSKPSMMLASCP